MISIDVSMIVVIINFLLLLFILQTLLYKPLKNMLKERGEKIASDLDEANNSKKEAERLVQLKDDEYKKSLLESRELREKMKVTAEKEAEEILIQANRDKDALVSDTQRQLANEKARVTKELQGELAGLVSKLSGQVLAQKIDSKKDLEIINSIIDSRSK